MAKPRPIPDLTEDVSYGEAAAMVIAARARELGEHSRGVLDTGHIERVHDMRVATRRLRAALEVFEPCFPARPYKQALREVKALADALGERRDRDVGIALLQELSEGMEASDRDGIASLIGRLRDEQAQANMELAPLVDAQRRLTPLVEDLQRLANAAGKGGRVAERSR